MIKDGCGPTDQWKEARRIWDKTKGGWKSWLPWYGLKYVRVVEVSFRPRPRNEQVVDRLVV